MIYWLVSDRLKLITGIDLPPHRYFRGSVLATLLSKMGNTCQHEDGVWARDLALGHLA